MKRHWLITAFAPFLGRAENNSGLVLNEIKTLVAELSGPEWPFEIHFFTLPVEYDRCFTLLQDELARLQKNGIKIEGILSIGEGQEDFKIETQAHNLDDVPSYPDNAGVVRVEKRIITTKGAPDIFKLRFPFEAFARIRSSVNAGFFVCNHLCARAANEFASDPKKPYFGFIHVPKSGEGGIFTYDVCAAMIVNSFKKIK